MAEFSTITLLKLTLVVMSISENGKLTSAPIIPLNMVEMFIMDFTMLFCNMSRIPDFANYALFLYYVLNIFFLLFLSYVLHSDTLSPLLPCLYFFFHTIGIWREQQNLLNGFNTTMEKEQLQGKNSSSCADLDCSILSVNKIPGDLSSY